MYNLIKRTLLQIFPKRFVYRFEFVFRWLYSLVYIGSNVKCPVCEGTFSGFIPLSSGDLLCPYCGSLPRHRRLWLFLRELDMVKDTTTILHFSPSRILRKKLRQLAHDRYISTDYDPDSVTDRHYDITEIPVPDENFDLIICFHILEHIVNDMAAMRELFRVAKKGGIVLIQTPFSPGAMIEEEGVTEPAERLRRFGQEDHVRIYSVESLSIRLQQAGFTVEKARFHPDPVAGLRDEIILICRKTT